MYLKAGRYVDAQRYLLEAVRVLNVPAGAQLSRSQSAEIIVLTQLVELYENWGKTRETAEFAATP